MPVLNKENWQNIVITLATRFILVAFLLTKFWRKRLLARVATKRIAQGELKVPHLLLSSLNNKRLQDIKKSNLLRFKSNILTTTPTQPVNLPVLKKGHNKSVLLVVHNSLPYDSAGYAHRTIREAKAYQALGYCVSIVTRQGYPWDLAKHRNQLDTKSNVIDGIEIFTLKGNRRYKVDSDLKYAIEYGNQVAILAKKLDVGFIQASSNYINGLAGYIASRKSGIPFLYEARGMWHVTRASKEKGFSSTEAYKYEEAIERWVINNASAAIFITNELRKKYSNSALTKTAVLPNCIDDSEPVSQPSLSYRRNSKFRLLYAGSIVFYEGLDLLVEVVSKLESNGIELSIYGGGPDSNKIEGLISKLDSNNIHFFGRVEQFEVKQAYGSHHAVVVPRINSKVTSLVPPLKPLEAIWNGLPVITSDLPAIREIMGGVGSVLYIKPSNEQSLRCAILKLQDEYEIFAAKVKADQAYILKERSWKEQLGRAINQLSCKSFYSD